MDKVFNWISILVAAIGGFFVQILGGWDLLLKVLLFMVVLDFITGVIKATYLKMLSSDICFKGIIKKIMIFIAVAVSVKLGELTGNLLPLRESVIMFFAVNEGLSLLENMGEFISIPSRLKNILLQLRNNEDECDKGEK